MVARAVRYVRTVFPRICLEQQQILQSEKCVAVIFKILMGRSKSLYDRVRERWGVRADWPSLLEEVEKY
jgi:hypothetical protein